MTKREIIDALKNFNLKEILSTSKQAAETIAKEFEDTIIVEGCPFVDASGIAKILYRVIVIKEK